MISTIDTEGQIESITPFITPTYSSAVPKSDKMDITDIAKFRVARYELRIAGCAYSNKNLHLLTRNAKHVTRNDFLDFARVGGFHMQGT